MHVFFPYLSPPNPNLSMPHTISLLEDDTTFSKILANIINADADLQVISQYFNCAQIIADLQSNPTDIAIIDIQLPDGSGVEVVEKLKPLMPNTLFLMCTSFDDDDKIFNSLKAGASGYIIKSDDPENIVAHIKDAINGGAPMSAGVAIKIVKYFNALPKVEKNLQELTVKENEILQALSKGYLYKEIASQQNIVIDTVKKHCSNIYVKLAVNNKTEAINIYWGRK
jgi:two-component system, NarL family, response regulator LiaR